MIYKGSRYEGVGAMALQGSDGKIRKILNDRVPFTMEDVGENFIVHEFQAGEQLDGIAFRYYKKEWLWYLIADVNGILWPQDIAPRTKLVIPTGEIPSRL
jgi:hypothetical protein